MNIEANKAIIREWVAAWSARNFESLAHRVKPDISPDIHSDRRGLIHRRVLVSCPVNTGSIRQ
jgi:hypothetical protein